MAIGLFSVWVLRLKLLWKWFGVSELFSGVGKMFD